MKIIVTGGAGFIGSNLIRLLLSHSHSVLNLDKLTYAGNLQSLRDCEPSPNYNFQKLDIVDEPAVIEAIHRFAPDAIIHLAAESHVDRSIDSPKQFITTNVQGTYSLLTSAKRYWEKLPLEKSKAFRFLHVSTDEVFGSLTDTGYFTEETRYDPKSPYSASKAASDHLVRAWGHTYGLPVIITNCSNNYGPFQFPEKLIPVAILKCLREEPIPVYGNGRNVRDWLHVEDHCEALKLVLEKGTPFETYNIGGSNEQKNIDLVTTICETLDEIAPRSDRKSHKDLITFVPDRPGHDLRYAIDNSKITHSLNWKPRYSLSTGIRQTVEWYLSNRWWWEDILNGTYQLNRLGLNKLQV
jgi:dTDP-glucose 4,6-dehydratase